MQNHKRDMAQHSLSWAVVVTAIIALFPAANLYACTAFSLQGDSLVAGKNLDWYIDDGLIVVNKKGVSKRALLLDDVEKPAEWVSKYGSVTFNQYGREMPNGGMNESGLVVETLWLPNTQNPSPDDRPAVIAWVQFQLDNHRTASEVIDSDSRMRISPKMPAPLHFFVCDRDGNAAVIEFIGGKQVSHTANTLPVTLITNNTYEESISYLKKYNGFGGEAQIPYGSHESLDRFVIAAERLRTYRKTSAEATVKYAFDTLAAVKQGPATKWSVVYDLTKLQIHFRTHRRTQIKTIRLQDCDFSTASPVRVISINTPRTGLLNPYFIDYDSDLNRWLVFYTVRHAEQFKDLPEVLIERLARYPDTTSVK